MFIPNYLEEVTEGVWQRKEIIKSEDVYSVKHPKDVWLNILTSDKVHYKTMYPIINTQIPWLAGKYKRVVSPGGGLPKFETQILKANEITVYDFISDTYLELLDPFKEIYGIQDTRINYEEGNLYSPFCANKDQDCVCFVHFLEHSNNWDIVKEWIALQKTDIVIYGPNIEAAQGMNWHHFHNHKVDHNVYFTIEAMVELGESLGFTVTSLAYSDDMLVIMKK